MSAVPTIPRSMIEPNPDQPRKLFADDKQELLKDSIAKYGQMQPIVVIPTGNGKFMIIGGERRYRACGDLGMEEIKAVVLDDATYQRIAAGKITIDELALIENGIREGLTAVEEAQAYKNLIQKHGFTQKKIAKRFGKSPAYINERLALLDMSQKVQELVLAKQITFSAARELFKVKDPQEMDRLVEAAENGATVKQLKGQAKRAQAKKTQPLTKAAKHSTAKEPKAKAKGAKGPIKEAHRLIANAIKKLEGAPSNGNDAGDTNVKSTIKLLGQASRKLDNLSATST